MFYPSRSKAIFASEAELCQTFIKQIPKTWTAYAESCGFDILLVGPNGEQIGIEAKMKLNADVMRQIMEHASGAKSEGPDYRAVLIPWGCTSGLVSVCDYIGITVIEMRDKDMYLEERKPFGKDHHYTALHIKKFKPDLPDPKRIYWGVRDEWHDFAPVKQCKLPDYIPDVRAGRSAPVQLTEWKVKAIKICCILEKTGYVTRGDFDMLKLDHRRWMISQMGWLQAGETRGQYVAGPHFMDFKRQHPKNYAEIMADIEKWADSDVKMRMNAFEAAKAEVVK